MNFVLIIIASIIIFLVVINYLRKLHLDAIHSNFLALVDEIDGSVLRKGLLSRPVYHGTYQGTELTINFSSERAQKKRRQYLNISIARNSTHNITLSTEAWIKDRGENTSDIFESLSIQGAEGYLIKKPAGISFLKKGKKDEFNKCIKSLAPFNYIFIGQSGMLFERECENIATCTKHPKLKEDVALLFKLTGTIC